MKTNPFLLFTTGLAVLTPSIFALEAPADDAPPPPAAAESPRKNLADLPEIKLPSAKGPETQSQAAFLGVVSGDLPELLAEHLNLKPGEGIIVRSLVPDGPAAKSGVRVNDVICRVSGQPVGSPLDISKQIATHRAGEIVSLDLIHKGKPCQVEVALGLKPLGTARMEAQPLGLLDLDGLPKELADRVRDAIEGNLGGLDLEGSTEIPPRVEEAMRDLKRQMLGRGGRPKSAPANAANQSTATVKMKDQQGSVEVKSNDGSKEVTVRDPQEQITWSGPWDTEQDKAAAPADVRQRVDSLNLDTDFKGKGLRLQMRQAP
jgi:membrane-associated protease RseP (regulator of RpoE activity)